MAVGVLSLLASAVHMKADCRQTLLAWAAPSMTADGSVHGFNTPVTNLCASWRFLC
jgi:Co/Zn/Cd efflux system component